ncbi:vesicle transport through interaction with t-SNAREs homolog 1A isoform 3-T3 [Amazona ochrocephala]
MSSDFESYEQDFAVLTAEVTGRIGKVPKLVGDEKKQMVANIEKQLEEARELLEQMELEVREIPPQSRGMYSSRMRSYKQEMGKLEADFKRSRIAYSDEVRNELLGDDGNSSENQLIKLREERAHLLDNTERLERSSRRLEAGYQIAVETDDSPSSSFVSLLGNMNLCASRQHNIVGKSSTQSYAPVSTRILALYSSRHVARYAALFSHFSYPLA